VYLLSICIYTEDADLAGGTLQYGARKLLVMDNPVTPPPPAPVSGPPIGPGLVRPPPPPQEV